MIDDRAADWAPAEAHPREEGEGSGGDSVWQKSEDRMEATMTVRRIGGSLGGTFPKEVMERLNVGEGDKLHVVVKEGEIVLTPYDPAFDEAMKIYRRGARKYRNALRELAK